MDRVLDSLPDGDDLSLSRVSTAEYVAGRLRAMIADGDLSQGEHLREVHLAAAFSVSRTTIRDAIRTLVAEGLVDSQFHRGAVVTVLGDEDIEDLCQVRRVLELPALALVPGGSAEAAARGEQALIACRRTADQGDYGKFVEHELEFHAAIVSYHGSPRIDQFFGHVLANLRLALGALGAERLPSPIEALARRYREIFDAAREGEVAHAQRELGSQLDAYEASLRKSR